MAVCFFASVRLINLVARVFWYTPRDCSFFVSRSTIPCRMLLHNNYTIDSPHYCFPSRNWNSVDAWDVSESAACWSSGMSDERKRVSSSGLVLRDQVSRWMIYAKRWFLPRASCGMCWYHWPLGFPESDNHEVRAYFSYIYYTMFRLNNSNGTYCFSCSLIPVFSNRTIGADAFLFAAASSFFSSSSKSWNIASWLSTTITTATNRFSALIDST